MCTEEGVQAKSLTLLVDVLDGCYDAHRSCELLPGERKVFRVDLQSGIEVVGMILMKITA